MKQDRIKKLNKFEESIGYRFNNIDLLNTAFTHSSYVNEHKEAKSYNERVEFLGDSVVNLIITDILFKTMVDNPEGDLTKIRAQAISETSFARAARTLNIGEYLLLGKGEELCGGRNRDSLLADAFEALVGALYLDSNFEIVKDLINAKFRITILNEVENDMSLDYKTILQEKYFALKKQRVRYKLTKETGPDHDKTFYFSVLSDYATLGDGVGKNKKEAEQNAAKNALEKLGIINK